MIIASAAVAAGCTLTAGCAVTNKWANLDSISRRPTVGIELAPKKRDSAPETQRIRMDGSIPLEPEPAKLIANGPSKNPSWWQRLKGTETPKASISLPRTDLANTPEPQKLDFLPPTEGVEF